MLNNLKFTWMISNPSDSIISQIIKLFQKEWGDGNRWKDDLYFYFSEKKWKLATLNKNKQLIGALIYKHLPLSNSVALAYLIIHKSFRNKGIGTMIMKKIEGYAIDMGASAIFFDSSEPIGELRRHLFIDKLGYLIPKIPILFPDETPATYLFVKFLKNCNSSDTNYFKVLLKEYVNESYSNEELKIYENIFNLMFSTFDSLDRICLTRKLFLNDYPVSKYTKKQSKYFSIEDLRSITKRIISQPCNRE